MEQDIADDRLIVEIASLARGFAMSIVAEDLADDIAQDVALQCLTKIRAGQWRVATAELSDFVRRVVRRNGVDLRRQSRARERRHAEYALETSASQMWMSPELAYEEREQGREDEAFEKVWPLIRVRTSPLPMRVASTRDAVVNERAEYSTPPASDAAGGPARTESLMAPLSSSRFVETATNYIGISQTRDNYLSTFDLLRQLPIEATEEEWGVRFVQHVGIESQREASGGASHWPLPVVRTAAELAEVGGEAGAMREEPQPGDIFLLWSPAKRRYVRAGIVVAVEGEGQLYDGRMCFDCTTVECVSNRPSLERKVVRRQRRLTPNAGDCVVRWTDLAPPDHGVFEEAA